MKRILGRLCLTLPLAAAGGWLLFARSGVAVEPSSLGRSLPAAQVPPSPDGETTERRYVGAAGCAAANCHGGGGYRGGQQDPLGSEYTWWAQKDPHADAFAVLYNDESRLIVRNLRNSAKYESIRDAHAETICLNCHAVTPGATRHEEKHEFTLHDGVSCEACHGPAEDWLSAHKRADWNERSPEEKAALGFYNTKDLLTRARVCASCHVGAEGRDVNHDLVAAGHPRLNFELAAYQANMPAHWDRDDDRRRHAIGPADVPDRELRSVYETKLWALGQVVTSEQALKLLQTRAADSHELRFSAPWPEFTEYSCFACHHDLAPEAWRQTRGYPGRKPGQYPWGTWLYPLVPSVAAELDGVDLAGNETTFTRLRQEMAKPYPDRDEAAKMAGELQAELGQWAGRIAADELTPEEARQLLARVLDNGGELAELDWDAAAQTYLAAVALWHGLADASTEGERPDPTPLTSSLESIRDALRFPSEQQAPAAQYDSPRDYNQKKIERLRNEFQQIELQLAAP
ncbi:MAG: cytochrome c family protein [Planctomycetes bacterium]|nr:cytochrome c family protein [Planctomycetota bacterium]